MRLVYKQYPLKNIHAHAELAAKAAVAAGAQDKFWEMHHKLFSARGKLEQTDIEEYAKQIGFDMPASARTSTRPPPSSASRRT
ncbi:MAG: hypothetical protein R3F14_34615 [Polyangiaceae bacterium]